MTDIKDREIDQKPPPYTCSGCGFSTWSWTEAKNHLCRTMKEDLRKTIESGRSTREVISTSMDTPTFELLIRTLERAHDGSKGEFKESTLTLPIKSGRRMLVRAIRGAPEGEGVQGKGVFRVDIEISHED